MKKVIVLGSNFAGVSAALELNRKLKNEIDITVISPSAKFIYIPSLIWVPFGMRKIEDISFELDPIYKKKGIKFVNDAARQVFQNENRIETEKYGSFNYDYLVIATGAVGNYSILPNLDPKDGFVNCIISPDLAEKSFKSFEKLLDDPGPVIVGATQGASCMGAAYEYLFNLDKFLRKKGKRKEVEITWITPEPFLGHFGIGGIFGGQKMLEVFMKLYDIKWRTDVGIQKIEKKEITISTGEKFPYKMAMLIPPFLGAKALRNSPGLTDEKGFIATDEGYRHLQYKNIFAAGLAVQVVAPFKNCATPFGVPKTGFPSDVMGKIVSENILNDIKQTGKFKTMPFGKIPGICVMDAGNKEVWILTNHLFKLRQFELMIPNLIYNFGKRILEIYMLWKNRHGYSFLP